MSQLSSGKTFIALDGACRLLYGLDIVPDIILGDMDSADSDILDHFEKRGSKIVTAPDQNFSDFEKGVMYCHEHDAQSIDVFNACHDRMDHFIGNVFFLKKYYNPHCPIQMFTESACILFLRDGSLNLRVKIGAKCGFFGLPDCIISVSGVKYQLKRQSLQLGIFESVANEFTAENVRCDVRGDCLVTYEI